MPGISYRLDSATIAKDYFKKTDHVATSAGVADAGKPIILDAGGKLDSTFVDDHDVSHHELDDLTAYDDHSQYTLLAGRTGGQIIYGGIAASNNLTLASTNNATLGYVVIDGYRLKKSTLQTTDATATVIQSIAVAEGEEWQIKVKVLAQKSDNTDRASYNFEGTFYRLAAGNVTQIGTTVAVDDESDATWDCDFVLNTTAQSIDITVTGKLATTINWKSEVWYFKRD